MIVHDERNHYDLCVGRAPALVAGAVNDMITMEKQMTDASRDVVLWGPKIRVALFPMTGYSRDDLDVHTTGPTAASSDNLTDDTSKEEGSSCVNRRDHMVTSWSLSVRSDARPRRNSTAPPSGSRDMLLSLPMYLRRQSE